MRWSKGSTKYQPQRHQDTKSANHRSLCLRVFVSSWLMLSMESNITKVTTHLSPNESLIFERSQAGRAGFSLPPLDVEETALDEIIPRQFQWDDALAGIVEVTEV